MRMKVNKEHIIGALMVLGIAIDFLATGEFDGLWLAAELTILGVVAIFLYHFKTKGQTSFFLLKIPLNVIFNIFLFILLLKS